MRGWSGCAPHAAGRRLYVAHAPLRKLPHCSARWHSQRQRTGRAWHLTLRSRLLPCPSALLLAVQAQLLPGPPAAGGGAPWHRSEGSSKPTHTPKPPMQCRSRLRESMQCAVQGRRSRRLCRAGSAVSAVVRSGGTVTCAALLQGRCVAVSHLPALRCGQVSCLRCCSGLAGWRRAFLRAPTPGAAVRRAQRRGPVNRQCRMKLKISIPRKQPRECGRARGAAPRRGNGGSWLPRLHARRCPPSSAQTRRVCLLWGGLCPTSW